MSDKVQATYQNAIDLAECGKIDEARSVYEELETEVTESSLRALVVNDLGSLACLQGDLKKARQWFRESLTFDASCAAARTNLAILNDADIGAESIPEYQDPRRNPRNTEATGRTKVAILSFLFNWPSTGGGIVHTVELARFLEQAGYDVRLYHPHFADWGIGEITEACPFPTNVLEFNTDSWNVATIKDRFRRAVDDFSPDQVIVTDSWNFKPHLADAVGDYSYFLRMQALECLCPLNNLRLLPDRVNGFRQCSTHQLAAAETCHNCLGKWGSGSGSLHQAERQLSGVGTRSYNDLLRRVLKQATAVLTLNPLVAEMYRPYCQRVETVTWGMDEERFPWPLPERETKANRRTSLLFAGLTDEPTKGFDVLRAACARLWQTRQDFELVVTSEPSAWNDPFLRSVGWQSQADLPAVYRAADICVVPTVAQDGLSRTAVEAMACGKPVIGSRIGGVPFAIVDGVTGLLCEAGSVEDWTEKITRLLDDPNLRQRFGEAGRRLFEERFTWETVIERDYQPLLQKITYPAMHE